VLGGVLRVGHTVYLNGLGMHSPARVTYELAGDERRFESEVAIDAESGDRGSVVFRVFLDGGEGTWREGGATDIRRGGEPPTTLSVELAGAKRISLLVDFADHGDELDHADWLNARLVK
jgi:alpha-galactosidase